MHFCFSYGNGNNQLSFDFLSRTQVRQELEPVLMLPILEPNFSLLLVRVPVALQAEHRRVVDPPQPRRNSVRTRKIIHLWHHYYFISMLFNLINRLLHRTGRHRSSALEEGNVQEHTRAHKICPQGRRHRGGRAHQHGASRAAVQLDGHGGAGDAGQGAAHHCGGAERLGPRVAPAALRHFDGGGEGGGGDVHPGG